MFTALNKQKRFAYLYRNLALALAYYGTAELSRWLASTPQNVTPVWPPDGIAVAGVFLYGYGMLPGVCLGSFLANIWAFWDSSNWLSLSMSIFGVLGIALGTTLGTSVGVFGLRQSTSTLNPLSRVGHVIKLLLFAGLVGPTINAATGVAVLCSLDVVPWTAYSEVWLTWWISNVAGIFIVTPTIISWGQWASLLSTRHFRLPKTLNHLKRHANTYIKNGTEVTLMVGLVLLVGSASFWQSYPLEYILIPLLIWPTFRYGQQGATLAAISISAIAILGTVRGLGSFASNDLSHSLTLLQSFIAVTVFTALIVAAVLAERGRAEEKLKEAISALANANQVLEQRVSDRTQELDCKNQRLETTLHKLHQMQAQVVQSEKMSSLGQMVAGIAHEINNPVNFIHANIKHLQDYIEDMMTVISGYQKYYPEPAVELKDDIADIDVTFIQEDAPNILASMQVGTQRIHEIVLSLRNFSRLDESALKPVDIQDGLESTLLILKHRLTLPGGNNHIHLVRDYTELPQVECYPSQLNQVFMNILVNAIDALEQHGSHRAENKRPTIIVRTEVDQDWIRITLSDNGPGIDEAIQNSVFDPFFTTKAVGKGTGMGLSISYQIITQLHSGKLTCKSSIGIGTDFVIQIPRNQRQQTSETAKI